MSGAPRCQPRMIAGATLSSVSTLAKTRTRQTSQYVSPRNRLTTAASANDDTIGASSPAPPMNAATRRNESKRAGASLSARTAMAASNASLQLVTNSSAISVAENPAPISSRI